MIFSKEDVLISQTDERTRRFKLALRAGIPVLVLISLVLTTTIFKTKELMITLNDGILLTALTFITIYFIYFLMNVSVQETMIDATTQGFNKKAFIAKLNYCHPKSIASLNIMNLQTINENYSTQEVDSLLYMITKTLHLVFHQQGFNKVIIGRNSGSEFLIALNENDDNIKTILDKFKEKYGQLDGIDIEYRFAVITNTHDDLEKELLQLQDMIASQTVEEESDEERSDDEAVQDSKVLSSTEKDIIESIKTKKLLLSFRPLLNVNSNQIERYEIAVKLKSTNGKAILPRVFLPIVNRLGLGREYDLMLIQHVIDLLPLVNDKISFSFNLSPFSLRDGNFQKNLFNYLNSKEVNPSRIIIQLYERKTHHDLSNYLKVLKNFRGRGIKICIDNFGSSNASMEYMKHFKFDMVQFDRSYVTKIEDKTTSAMLHSLILMSKELEVKTIAKWVDTDAQQKKLTTLGIDYLQGFGIDTAISELTLLEKYN